MRCVALFAWASLEWACVYPSTSGTLHASGDALGTWDFTPSTCSNGDTREFYGTDLTDGTRTVRVFEDPLRGWAVQVWLADPTLPPDATFTESSGCTQLAPAISRNMDYASKNDHDEDDSAMSGALDIACASPAQGLQGHVAFNDCPNPDEEVPQ